VHASLITHEEKYGDLRSRRNLAGDKGFDSLVFRKLEKLIPLVETHMFAPFCPMMSQRRQPFNQAATNSTNPAHYN
jgi:hypothetical protein